MRSLDVELIFFAVVPALSEWQDVSVVCLLAEEIALVLFVFQDVLDCGRLPECVFLTWDALTIQVFGNLEG